MAQGVKVLATQPEDLVAGKSDFCMLYTDLHICPVACACSPTPINKCN